MTSQYDINMLLNDFASEKWLKYFLYCHDIKIFDNKSYSLADILETLLIKELLYLDYNITIDWKINEDELFSYHNRLHVILTLQGHNLYIHLSNIKSKKLKEWLWSEIIGNFISAIKEFNNKKLAYKFVNLRWYIKPDEPIIDLNWLKLFYEHNWFKINKNNIWNYSCIYNFVE